MKRTVVAMKYFADLHCHMLFGLDDGAQSATDMYGMLAAAYADGTRLLCMTPHYNPAVFQYDDALLDQRKAQAQATVKKKFPGMKLFFGQEVYATADILSDLSGGIYHTLGKTNALLIEFSTEALYFTMRKTLEALVQQGYRPILAHVERYRCLSAKPSRVGELFDCGIRMQSNAFTLSGASGFRPNRFITKLLKEDLISFAASDAHDLKFRRPELSAAYQIVCRKIGEKKANALFLGNAREVFGV